MKPSPCPKCGCPDVSVDSCSAAEASWTECEGCDYTFQKRCDEETLSLKAKIERELRTLAQQGKAGDHVEGKLGMVAQWSDAQVGAAMLAHHRSLKAGKLPSEAWRDALDAAAPAPDHSAGVGGVVADACASEHIRRQVGRIDMYRLRMSYSESYFGEPAGLLKSVVAELARAVGPIYPEPMPEADPLAGVVIYTASATYTDGVQCNAPKDGRTRYPECSCDRSNHCEYPAHAALAQPADADAEGAK